MLFKQLTGLVAVALTARAAVLPHAIRQENSTADYDYVVIGSGAGGGPLASRLAIGGAKVLLIEAGDDQGIMGQNRWI
jgi:ribulose 1,5-bisphosphate synthetase/thiazole synthase